MTSRHITTTSTTFMRPTGFAETILISTILLAILCVVAVGLRTWQRVRDRSFHVDDAVTWLGLVTQQPAARRHSDNADLQQISNLAQYSAVGWGTTVGIGSPDSMIVLPMVMHANRADYCKPSQTPQTLSVGQDSFPRRLANTRISLAHQAPGIFMVLTWTTQVSD